MVKIGEKPDICMGKPLAKSRVSLALFLSHLLLTSQVSGTEIESSKDNRKRKSFIHARGACQQGALNSAS